MITELEAGDVRGGKGGKGGKGGSAAKSDKNTLKSNANARMVEAISEGPIHGLVNGASSIYYDQTPLVGVDGVENFSGVTYQFRSGNPDDEHIQGHAFAETNYPVETPVTKDVGPVVRTITDPSVDAVMVIVRVDTLFVLDKKGAAKKTDLTYEISVRPFGGTWETVETNEIKQEKCTSPVQIGHRVELPLDGAPWDIRVEKITPDPKNDKTQVAMTFESFSTKIEGRFTYPHTAVIATEVNAEALGQQIPQRAYHIRGLLIEVPDNYDPETRTYSGVWNGKFKIAFSSCPAWIFWDLLRNNRYGLGDVISDVEVSSLKWQLYTIGQYCDEGVPSGLKDDEGNDVIEPRFSFNGAITNRQEAYQVLSQITASFRGMGFWALGQIFASADMPSDPVKLVTPSNVTKDGFKYSSTATKARHSVAIVTWNNPDNFYQPEPELVVNNHALQKNGWREKRVALHGCTSRGLAHRYGSWILDVENFETETVEYQASFDHMDIKPGDIIAIADPRKANVRMGGRVSALSPNSVTLDHAVSFVEGETYEVWLTKTDGTVHRTPVSAISDDEMRLSVSILPDEYVVGSVFVITGTDVKPIQYRITSISEEDENLFSVTALLHDPNKYARVEQGVSLDPIPYTRELGSKSPIGLKATDKTHLDEMGQVKPVIELSWSPPRGFVPREYVLQMDTPSDKNKFITSTPETTVLVDTPESGDYSFYVTTIDRKGQASLPAEIHVEFQGISRIKAGRVSDLKMSASEGSIFEGRDVSVCWKNIFPASVEANSEEAISNAYDHNLVRVKHSLTGTILREELVRADSYTYLFDANRADCVKKSLGIDAARDLKFEVACVSKGGISSDFQSLSVSNPIPDPAEFSVVVDRQEIRVSIAPSSDTDVKGVKVWIEKDSDFSPNEITPKFTGSGSFFSWPGEIGATYFVRVGYYDFFSDTVTSNKAVTVRTSSKVFTDEEFEKVTTNAKATADQAIGAFRDTDLAPVQADLGGLQDDVSQHTARLQSEVDRLAETSVAALLQIGATQQQLFDAGLRLNPDTGQAELYAVKQQAAELVDLKVKLDAQAGVIKTQATLAQVNQAIAAAQLNDADLAALTDVIEQVTQVEQELNTVTASLAQKASVLTQNALSQSLTQATSKLDALAETVETLVTDAQFTDLEARLKAAQDSLSTLDIPTMRRLVYDVQQQRAQVDQLAENAIETALVNQAESLENFRRIAAVDQKATAGISEQGEAIARLRNQLLAQFDGAQAAITREAEARASADEAIAKDVETVTAQVDGHGVAITQQSQAIAGLSGTIQMSVNNNGHLAGWALTSEVQAGGAVDSSFVFVADKFQISSPDGGNTPFITYTTPQVIDGTQVPPGSYLQDAMIRNGVIGSAHIGKLEVDTAHIKHGAITNRFAAYTAERIDLWSSWREIQALDIECSGNSVSIEVNLSVKGAFGARLQVLLDGVVIREFPISGNAYQSTVGSITLNFFHESMQSCSLVATPAAGSRRVSVRANRGSLGHKSPFVRNVFLSCTENKR